MEAWPAVEERASYCEQEAGLRSGDKSIFDRISALETFLSKNWTGMALEERITAIETALGLWTAYSTPADRFECFCSPMSRCERPVECGGMMARR